MATLKERGIAASIEEAVMGMYRPVLVSLALSFSLVSGGFAQDVKPYREGPVTELSYIKIKPGKFDEYMKYLGGQYKALMEGYKNAGLITGYAVYSSTARSPHEPDLILSITYPNMAALDKIDEIEAIDAKVAGSRPEQFRAYADRESIREVLGAQLIRELVLK